MLNAPSVIVLLVVAALLFLALRSILKRGKGGSACSCCSAQCCPGPKHGRPCPSAQRAAAQVDSQLDQAHCE